jgi:hypothetical protein
MGGCTDPGVTAKTYGSIQTNVWTNHAKLTNTGTICQIGIRVHTGSIGDPSHHRQNSPILKIGMIRSKLGLFS